MTEKTKHDSWQVGQRTYEQWRDKKLAEPNFRKIYEREATQKELWLQLTEARQAAGLTQAELATRLGVSPVQVSRMEKRGYESYTLRTLQRYIQALGEDFALEIAVRRLSVR